MTKRRLIAYIYDSCVLTLCLLLTYAFLPVTENMKKLDEELVKIKQNYLEQKINDEQFLNQYININQDIDKEKVPYVIVNIVYILVFFVVVPLKNNNQTLGQKKMAIKMVKEKGKITANDLIYRNFIINGLLQLVICLGLVYFVPKTMYFYSNFILSFIQFILVIISIFMILYRKDKKGLHDLWTKTYIEEVK